MCIYLLNSFLVKHLTGTSSSSPVYFFPATLPCYDSNIANMFTNALLGLLAILIGKRLLSWARINIKRQSHGCKPSPRYPHRDPNLGLDYLWTELQEREEGASWAGDRNRFAHLGRTFEVNSWGNRTIVTMDAQNIQEVLSTSFNNFGVQDMRLAVRLGWLYGHWGVHDGWRVLGTFPQTRCAQVFADTGVRSKCA